MVLYLSRNENANLLDKVAQEKSLHVRKMSGSFCLSEFIIRDMRKFASCQYFCVERLAITEKDNEFLEALQSFQMMYNARIIVIYESTNEVDGLVRGLVQIGVTDIVTAPDMVEKLGQLGECLSVEGMLKYKPTASKAKETDEEKETLAQSLSQKEMEDEQYRFDCLNVKIGIIGSTRRVGTTTVAMGLANFIKHHGGTACYVSLNLFNHLEHIANANNLDTEEDYYTLGSVDFYESMLPKHDYNFIINDFGDMKREAVKRYKECDIFILCGASNKLHEVVEFAEALKPIKSVKPMVLTYIPNPDYGSLFSTTVTSKPVVIKPVKSMLDCKTNGLVYKSIIEKYIVETSKRF